jgi:HSP20 family protein
MNDVIEIPADKNSEESARKDEGRLALDIFETEVSIFIVAPVAGVAADKIEILINEDVLTIRGSREFPSKLPKAKNFFLQECFWGKFSRSVLLPAAVNSAEIKAKMKNNVLVIAVPKAKKANSQKISIQPGE